jgi:3-mercaptopyruvate sulfurtransferase SseA
VLREMGFPDVANLETGFNSWKAAGLPVEGAPADAPKEAGPAWKSR